MLASMMKQLSLRKFREQDTVVQIWHKNNLLKKTESFLGCYLYFHTSQIYYFKIAFPAKQMLCFLK